MNSINNDISLCVASELSLEHEPVVDNTNEDELRVETRNIMEDIPMQSVDSHTPEQTSQHYFCALARYLTNSIFYYVAYGT
jgi:hypothetical protein